MFSCCVEEGWGSGHGSPCSLPPNISPSSLTESVIQVHQKPVMQSEQAPHLHGSMSQQCPLKLDRHTQGDLLFSTLVVIVIKERRCFACLYEESPTFSQQQLGSLKQGIECSCLKLPINPVDVASEFRSIKHRQVHV